MAISTRRTSVEVAVSGQSQSVVSPSIVGIIDQIIVTSTEPAQTFNLKMQNFNGDNIFPARTFDVERDYEIRPDLPGRGELTITVEDPVPASGTITVVLLERLRGG